jgi:hypothetical protein
MEAVVSSGDFCGLATWAPDSSAAWPRPKLQGRVSVVLLLNFLVINPVRKNSYRTGLCGVWLYLRSAAPARLKVSFPLRPVRAPQSLYPCRDCF